MRSSRLCGSRVWVKCSMTSSPVAARRGPRYLEVDLDVGSSRSAAHVVGLVSGALKGLVIDLAVVLEGRTQVKYPPLIPSSLHTAVGDSRTPCAMQSAPSGQCAWVVWGALSACQFGQVSTLYDGSRVGSVIEAGICL